MTKDKLIPEVNIGLIGHVDHGKTTLVKALSGKWTDTHSEEIKRGITIRIGYADFTIRKCKCPSPQNYTTDEKCESCGKTEISRTISLVDAPGHETLMANVLSGAAIMDGALFLISADEKCPQAQTREHLLVLNVMGIKNIVVVQNKIDSVSPERAEENYNEIKEFIKGTVAENAPIIPISALHKINIDALLDAIETNIPTPKRDENKHPELLIARSFDINKLNTPIIDLKGGVIGGSLIQGILKKGDEIEILPGVKDDKIKWNPLKTRIANIRQGNTDLEKATPGGLLAVETYLDPSLTKSDHAGGGVVGKKGEVPPVSYSIDFEFHALPLEHLGENLGIKMNEPLMLNVGTAKTAGLVTKTGKLISADLKIPVSAWKGQKIAVSKMIGNRWRLIGYGILN